VHPELAGIVQRILFMEGQPIRSGEVMLKIDDRRLRAEADSSRAGLRLAERNLERATSLRQSNNLAEMEYDRAVAEFERTAAELALIRTMQGKTEIKAPFDGIVGARSVSPGDYVTPQTAITSVDDLSQIRVTFDVPQRYLDGLQVGATFAVRVGGVKSAEPVIGKVYFVSATINQRTRSSQVDGLLTDPPESLKPGMFVNVDLVLGVREQVLVVPEGGIFMSVSGPQIVLAQAADDGFEAVFLPVELGLRRDGIVEVRTSAAIEGESVVAAGVGALALYPGTRLEPRPAVGSYNRIEQY